MIFFFFLLFFTATELLNPKVQANSGIRNQIKWLTALASTGAEFDYMCISDANAVAIIDSGFTKWDE